MLERNFRERCLGEVRAVSAYTNETGMEASGTTGQGKAKAALK
jgi:hypothetical protein